MELLILLVPCQSLGQRAEEGRVDGILPAAFVKPHAPPAEVFSSLSVMSLCGSSAPTCWNAVCLRNACKERSLPLDETFRSLSTLSSMPLAGGPELVVLQGAGGACGLSGLVCGHTSLDHVGRGQPQTNAVATGCGPGAQTNAGHTGCG